MGAILSKVVPATFSTIASFSKLIWRSEHTSPVKSPKKLEQKPQPFARGMSNTRHSFAFSIIISTDNCAYNRVRDAQAKVKTTKII